MWFSTKQDSSLGKVYQDGQIIVKQGDEPGGMFVILEGRVEILVDEGLAQPFSLTILGKDNAFGGVALYDGSARIATARALGTVRLLSLDKKGFLQWLGEDPAFSLRVILRMAERIRTLISQVVQLRRELRQAKGFEP